MIQVCQVDATYFEAYDQIPMLRFYSGFVGGRTLHDVHYQSSLVDF